MRSRKSKSPRKARKGGRMSSLKKNVPVLAALGRVNKKQAKTLIKDSSPDLIHCICEICHNLLQDNIPLSECDLKKVKKHKKIIRALATRGESVKKKKKIILNQKGGILPFLPLLLPALASAAGGLIGKAIGKRI